MRAIEQCDLRAGDRLQTELFGLLGERHRAVQSVVVRERERGKTELRSGECELFGKRGAVQERECGVAVELGVHRSRNAEVGTRNVQGFCTNHSPVIKSSNNSTRPPPSSTTSTYRRTIGCRHHSSSMRQFSPMDSTRFSLLISSL